VRYWAIVVSADRWASERAYHHDVIDAVDLVGLDEVHNFLAGDRVALIADLDSPVVFGIGEVRDDPALPAAGRAVVAYTSRFLDAPRPTSTPAGPITRLDAAAFAALTELDGAPPRTGAKKAWLVSLDLPIEADTPAEASRLFWSYVRELGPRELPTFVSPADDALAMQAMVGGEPVNLDPEEAD